MFELRPYQSSLVESIDHSWTGGARNVVATAPTGAGKTVIFSHMLSRHLGAACVIAHRQELVSQISFSLAAYGVRHSIIGPRSIIKFIVRTQIEEFGASFYDPQAPIAVAGVDTLRTRGDSLRDWRQQVTLWVLDEAHHLLRENKWGSAVDLFPNARGLGVTATPCRADGKGLGRHADGLFDELVEGPAMAELIAAGYLCPYKILAPPSDLDIESVPLGSTGDFNQVQLRRAMHRAHLVGDVVSHYLRNAPGKLGITFAVDVEAATEFAAEFNSSGVPAAVVSAKTPDRERQHLLRRYRARDLLQLVNVDLFGEGFDLPAIECLSMARPTASYPLYCQQFGRALRPMEGKERAIILDHVGNVQRHNGPPDRPRVWTLDRRETMRRGERDPDEIPYRVCDECTEPYEAVLDQCPNCERPYTPQRRDGPEHVDGNLVELDEAVLAELYGEIERVQADPNAVRIRMEHAGAPPVAAAGAASQQRKRREAHQSLQQLIGLYGGVQRSRGRSDTEAYRRFWHRYGVDVLTAQTLSRPKAEELSLRLIEDLRSMAL